MVSSVPTEVRRQIERGALAEYHGIIYGMGAKDITLQDCWHSYWRNILGMLIPSVCAGGALDMSNERIRALGEVTLKRALAAIEDPEAAELHGIDREESVIELARSTAAAGGQANANFHVGELTELPFEDNFFDAAHCHTVMLYVPDTQAALTEIKRVLKPGGILSCRERISASSFFEPNAADSWAVLERMLSASGTHPQMGKELKGAFHEAGFTNIRSSASITDSQSESISVTIAAALIVLATFFWMTMRQPTLAFIAVGPIALVLIAVLGTMALLDIPYTIVTSIITALSIGIGVDYTIHIIHRYREEYTRDRDPERAAIQTLSTTGSALLGSALTTALGIGALIASPLAASQQFGFTAAITIAYSLIVSILVVPPLMTIWGAYQNMRLRSNTRRWAEELDAAIEAVHRRDAR